MNGKLNEHGDLSIERANGWTEVFCPFSGGEVPCGAWCSQFTDPHPQHNKKFDRDEIIIHLCHGKHWKFRTFEDRRNLV